jgi:predicted HTH transcriptional regulator
MMRIFKDLELVEHLGSGIPRILEVYPQECFRFTENFLRMTFPNAWDLAEDGTEKQVDVAISDNTMQVTMQDAMQLTMQVEQLILNLKDELSREELQKNMNIKNRDYFRKAYIIEALNTSVIELTIPGKPNSKYQKYRLTEKGKTLKNNMKNDS